jgi:hypothetical protein
MSDLDKLVDDGQAIILRLSQKSFRSRRTQKFARSLVRQWDTTGSLTSKQWFYAKQMAGEEE